MNQSSKAYNALTGAELKQIILREVERALVNANIESAAITYPLASWSWELKLFQQAGETRERQIQAGHPKEVETLEQDKKDGRLDAAMKFAGKLAGGSKRFHHDPPSPSEVRTTEKLMPQEG